MFIYLVRAYKVRILQPWSPSLKWLYGYSKNLSAY
jgi:hypothetical protein